MKNFIQSFLALSLFLFASPSFAKIQRVPDALVCMDATQKIEKYYNIPNYILSAVALTETGKTMKVNKNIKFQTAWPWTANIEGKGYYFKTKEEAIQKISSAIRSGKRSIDVGCMQINLKYHNSAFRTLSEAFDPYANVQYAAEFLTSLHKTHKNWSKTVARYHSATPAHYNRYRKVVTSNWYKAESLLRPRQGIIFNYLTYYDNYYFKKAKEKTKQEISQEQYLAFRKTRMQEVADLRARIRTHIDD